MMLRLSVLTLVALVGACASVDRRVRVSVYHPSALSRYGQRIGVSPFDNDIWTRVAERVQRRIEASRTFEVAEPAQQQMRLIGTVQYATVGPETLFERPHTCVRQVPELRTREVPVFVTVPAPPSSDGRYVAPTIRTEIHTEQYTEMVDQSYGCIQIVRAIPAQVSVQVAVNALTQPIRQVYSRTVALSDQDVAIGLRGSDANDHLPGPVDGPGLLQQLLERVADQVAADLLPRTGAASVEFADCSDRRCDDAIALARNGGWSPAILVLSGVVTQYQNASDESSRRRLAGALFNRGILRGFHGEIGDGIADIQRAITTHLIDPAWARYLQALQELAREQDDARFRGETQSLDERHGGDATADADPEALPAPPRPRARGSR
jgi:hypothetical protein